MESGALTQHVEVAGQRLLRDIVVCDVQHLQDREGTEATGQGIQTVHAARVKSLVSINERAGSSTGDVPHLKKNKILLPIKVSTFEKT